MGRNLLMLCVIGLSAMMLGCGTITTVFREDAVTSRNLREGKSRCGAVPRVYSGVMYDFCRLHAEPGQRELAGSGFVMWFAIEGILSGVFDTVLLPYTLYRQSVDGSIEVGA